MTSARSMRRLRYSIPVPRRKAKVHPYAVASAVGIVALAATALINRQLAKKAERNNPATGRFLELNGVRLHYVERGSGEPLVLLHGNGSMIEDFESSGLIDLAAKNYRVVVFDRPGFGHSDRPRKVVWTPEAQAELIKRALERLDVSNAIVLGHSWGASVAVALALKYPNLVRGLVLASGYYYPTARPDLIAMGAPSLPLIGDILSYTLSPLISRAIWPLMMAKIFGPRSVPKKFEAFPKEMALRPSQIRASAAEFDPDDSERIQDAESVCGPKDAHRHHCRRTRSTGRHRHSVGTTAFRHLTEQASSAPSKRPHDPADGYRAGDVGDRRSSEWPNETCSS